MSPVKSRRAEYTESTRDAVLDSAAELFVRQGYGGTSLDEVAVAARVTKGAIYHHFANKAAVMTALIERMELVGNAAIRDRYTEVTAREGAAAGALAAVDMFLDQCSDTAYATVVFREAPIALGWREWRACEEKYAASIVEEILASLVDAGVVPAPLTGTLVSLVFGMLGTAGQLLADTPEADRARVRGEARATMAALLAGIAAQAGDAGPTR